MPQFVQNYPLNEAAGAFAGLGQLIQNILLQVPQLKAHLADVAAERAFRERELGSLEWSRAGQLGVEQERLGLERGAQASREKYQSEELGLQKQAATQRVAEALQNYRLEKQRLDSIAQVNLQHGKLFEAEANMKPDLLNVQTALAITKNPLSSPEDMAAAHQILSRYAQGVVGEQPPGPGASTEEKRAYRLKQEAAQSPGLGARIAPALAPGGEAGFAAPGATIPPPISGSASPPIPNSLSQRIQEVLPSVMAPPTVTTNRVAVRNKQGVRGFIPADQLQQAIKEGYTPIK